MLPLTDLARMLRGRAPKYSGMLRVIDPTERVLALIRIGFSAGFLAVGDVVVVVVVADAGVDAVGSAFWIDFLSLMMCMVA